MTTVFARHPFVTMYTYVPPYVWLSTATGPAPSTPLKEELLVRLAIASLLITCWGCSTADWQLHRLCQQIGPLMHWLPFIQTILMHNNHKPFKNHTTYVACVLHHGTGDFVWRPLSLLTQQHLLLTAATQDALFTTCLLRSMLLVASTALFCH